MPIRDFVEYCFLGRRRAPRQMRAERSLRSTRLLSVSLKKRRIKGSLCGQDLTTQRSLLALGPLFGVSDLFSLTELVLHSRSSGFFPLNAGLYTRFALTTKVQSNSTKEGHTYDALHPAANAVSGRTAHTREESNERRTSANIRAVQTRCLYAYADDAHTARTPSKRDAISSANDHGRGCIKVTAKGWKTARTNLRESFARANTFHFNLAVHSEVLLRRVLYRRTLKVSTAAGSRRALFVESSE